MLTVWTTTDGVPVIPLRAKNEASTIYKILRGQGFKTVRFLLDVTAQALLSELSNPHIFKAVSDYYIYPAPIMAINETVLHTLESRLIMWNNGYLYDETKQILCSQCFLLCKLTSESCAQHGCSPLYRDAVDAELVPCRIPLRNKEHETVDYALVDSEDFEHLMQYKWHCNPGGYAQCRTTFEGRRTNMIMHRFIMGAKKGEIVDHVSQKKIDNRRKNLRFVTRGQNAQNVPLRSGTSKYRGVSYAPSSIQKPWGAMCGGTSLGYYKMEEHAAYAYDCRALELYGPHAPVNDIPKPDDFKPWVRRDTAERVVIDGIEAPGLTIHRTSTALFYRLGLRIKGERFQQTFNNIEDAKKKYLELRCQMNPPDPNTVMIPRNENGDAVLPCNNTAGVIVDDDVYLKFYLQKVWLNNGYPQLTISGKKEKLHRLVCEAENDTIIIDHIDNDVLHCKRNNLRPASASLNAHNQRKRKATGSMYSGVSYNKKSKYFQVEAMKEGIRHFAGNYKDEKVAGFASDCLRKELWGESARLNNIELEGYIFVNYRAICQIK